MLCSLSLEVVEVVVLLAVFLLVQLVVLEAIGLVRLFTNGIVG